jgi:phosphatidylinositol glycan class B
VQVMRRVVLTCLLVRVFIALVTSTFFQPDEYYQSLEPAHQLVFGYGFLTWEWLSPFPIRSIAYPALNIPIYWVIKQAAQFKIIRSTTVEDILVVRVGLVTHPIA